MMDSSGTSKNWKGALLTAIDALLAAALIAAVCAAVLFGARTRAISYAELNGVREGANGLRAEIAELKDAVSADALLAERAEKENAALENERGAAAAELQNAISEREYAEGAYSRALEKRREYAALIRSLEDKIQSGESSLRIAYLTIDDGPSAYTERFLNTLKSYGAKATFFTMAHEERADTYRRMALEGHAVANHTYSHGISGGLYSSAETFMADVEKQEAVITELAGLPSEVVRFPGGSSSAGARKADIKQALSEAGYGWADWDASVGDTGKAEDLSVQSEINSVATYVSGKKTAVILMHDFSAVTAKALPSIIELLEGRGYILLPLFYDSAKVNK